MTQIMTIVALVLGICLGGAVGALAGYRLRKPVLEVLREASKTDSFVTRWTSGRDAPPDERDLIMTELLYAKAHGLEFVALPAEEIDRSFGNFENFSHIAIGLDMLARYMSKHSKEFAALKSGLMRYAEIQQDEDQARVERKMRQLYWEMRADPPLGK